MSSYPNGTTIWDLSRTADVPFDTTLPASKSANPTDTYGVTVEELNNVIRKMAYKSNYDYQAGMSCIYQGNLYQCINQTTGLFVASDWEQIGNATPANVLLDGQNFNADNGAVQVFVNKSGQKLNFRQLLFAAPLQAVYVQDANTGLDYIKITIVPGGLPTAFRAQLNNVFNAQISHNLNNDCPVVACWDDQGRLVTAQVERINNNKIYVEFTVAFTGLVKIIA